MNLYNAEFTAQLSESSVRPVFVARLEFSPTDVLYFTSAPVTGLTGANVILAADGFSGVSQRYDHWARISTIGNVTVEFSTADLVPEIASRFSNGTGIRNMALTIYVGTRDIDWANFETLFPYTVQSVSSGPLVTRLSAADPQRGLDAQLFEAPTGIHLTKTLEDTQTDGYLCVAKVGTGSDPELPVVYRDESHQVRPAEYYGVVRLQDELILHGELEFDEIDGWRVPIIERSALGSLRQKHEYDPDSSLDRQINVQPWVYLEGPALKVMYALITGEIWGTLETLPDWWHAGVSATKVNLSEYLAYPEIWDTNDDTGRMVRINGPEPVRAREYLQEQLLVWVGGLMPVRSNGALGFKPRVATLRNAPADLTIGDDDILSAGDLEWDQNQLGNVIRVKWQRDPVRGIYLQETLLLDSTSGDQHGYAPQTVFDLPFVHSTQSTQNRLIQFLNTWRDLYAHPPMEWEITVGPHLLGVTVGDVLRVNYPGLTDPTTGQPLVRTWEVLESQLDWNSGDIRLNLFSATGRAAPVATTSSNQALPDSFYDVGTDLASLVTISSGVVQAPLNLPAGIYHYHGDLNLGAHEHLVNGVVQLRVRGFLEVPPGCTINGRGRGNNDTEAGVFGVTHGGMSHYSRARRQRNTLNPFTDFDDGSSWDLPNRWVVARPYRAIDGETIGNGVAAATYLGIRNENGSASITTDIKPGGAGATSRPVSAAVYTAVPPRASGGASLAIVSRGLSVDIDAVIDTSGADGSLGARYVDNDYDSPGRGFLNGWKLIQSRYHYAHGSSAGGLPGALYVVLDGYHLPPNLSGTHVAEQGASPDENSDWEGTVRNSGGDYSDLASYAGRIFPGSGGENFTGVATVVQYAPPEEDTGEIVNSQPPAPDAVSIDAVTVTPDLPPTEDKLNASIEVDISRGAADSAVVYFRKQGSSVWRRHGEVLSSAVIVVPNQAAVWEVQARPVRGRQEQTSGPVALATIAATPVRPVALVDAQYQLSSDPSYGSRGDIMRVLVVAESDDSDAAFSHCRFERRNTAGGAWISVSASGALTAAESLPANGITWQYRITPVSVDDLTGPPLTIDVVLPRLAVDQPQDDYTPVPPIRRLRIVNADPENPERWIGAAPEFAWARLSATQGVPLGSEGEAGAGAGTEDSWLRGYRIRVYNTQGQLLRTEVVTDSRWEYAPELNKADGVGRLGELEVHALPRIGSIGKGQRIAFNNPAPDAPQNIREEVGYTSIGLSWDVPLDADFHGVKVFLAEQGEDPFSVDGNPRLIRNNQVIVETEANATVVIGLEAWDQFGPGGRTTRTVQTRQVPIADIDGLGPWASVEQADRNFINAWLAQDVIESEKIANLAAAKLTAGVIKATVGIGSEGLIYTDNNGYQVTMGAVDRPGVSANPLMWHMWDGANAINWFDAAGQFGLGDGGVTYDGNTVTVDGHVVAQTLELTGTGSGYGNLIDAPGSLADLDSTANSKLSGIETGATKTEIIRQNTAPSNPHSGMLWMSPQTKLVQRWNGSNWEFYSTYTTDTNDLSDGAGLGQTADWGQVSGTGKPADYADNTEAVINGGLTVTGSITGLTMDAGVINGTQINGTEINGSLFQTTPDQSGDYAVLVGNVLRTAVSPHPLLIHTWNGSDSTFSVDEAGKVRARDVDISGNSRFAGILDVAKIDASGVEIRAASSNAYSRSVAVISGGQIFSGGSTATAVDIGGFWLPGHSGGPWDSDYISTVNGEYIIVAGIIQFRMSVWTTEYKIIRQDFTDTGWQQLGSSPTISLDSGETEDARIFPWSFGIPIWNIASTTDREILFRLRRVGTAGSTPRINSWRISMWYTNL